MRGDKNIEELIELQVLKRQIIEYIETTNTNALTQGGGQNPIQTQISMGNRVYITNWVIKLTNWEYSGEPS